MGIAYNPRIVTDGLVLALDAGNAKSYPGSGTTWYDLSGNGNDGSLVNGVGYNSGNLGSLSFDGVDDYIQGTNVSAFQNSAFTIEVGFKLLENLDGDNFRGFFSTLSGSSSGFQLFWHSSQYFYLFVTNSVVVNTSSDAGTIPSGTTINLVARYDNSDSTKCSIFVNDVKYSNNQSGSYTNPVLAPRFFGRRADSTVNYGLNCNAYFVRYYNRALTDDEIQQNYNATKSRFQ